MVFPPRSNPEHANSAHTNSPRPIDRRTLLRAGVLAGSAALLAACGKQGAGGSAAPAKVARTNAPVTLAFSSDNPAIGAAMAPEKGATLRLLNYADYLSPDLIKSFGQKYGCQVEVTTFTTMTEAVEKLRTGSTRYDVFFPTADVVGRVAQAKLLQPLNHDYLGNLGNAWPSLQNPFYDQGSRYTVPYNVYSSGIGYRADKVTAIPANAYDLFWDPAYAGKVYLLDDYREALAMTMLHRGHYDLNTEDPAALALAGKDLAGLLKTVQVKLGTQEATLLPQGAALVHQAWSGDMVSAQSNLAKGQPVTQLGYWYPEHGKGVVGTDCMAVVRGAPHPVLAHLFLDYLLDTANAGTNMSWIGYQPAQTAFTPDYLVKNQYVPANLTSAIVTEAEYRASVQLLELTPTGEKLWQNTWAQFNAGS
ncbi:polyamine ABC transporter substrate-binding protein [Streptacidiphilus rugosus]|uniref:polyamine ABC transporter substrate-binding protein n=1 Tax=Streptacidiphilus rugosus TaxID=405783 RepID=UPI00068CB96F|nr:spermidine/putrescine ABC transporter substrate-binding protein [Streptacidiphilus rugosus]